MSLNGKEKPVAKEWRWSEMKRERVVILSNSGEVQMIMWTHDIGLLHFTSTSFSRDMDGEYVSVDTCSCIRPDLETAQIIKLLDADRIRALIALGMSSAHATTVCIGTQIVPTSFALKLEKGNMIRKQRLSWGRTNGEMAK